jgi:hypothetical protein
MILFGEFNQQALEERSAMRNLLIVLILIPFPVWAGEKKAEPFRFMKTDAGKVPKGWKVAKSGKGEGSVWQVVADKTAPGKTGHVLAQVAASPRALFNLCVPEKGSYRDVHVSVQFKAVKGDIDQGGGIVWRYQDADNYYVARMNPLEENFRLYKVVSGKRIQLATTKNDVKVLSGTWHKLAIRHIGDHIECFLDGKKLLDAKDDTIAQAGLVGLWTKADAQTYFDMFLVQATMGKKEE